MKKRPLPPNTKLHSEKAERVFKGVRFDTYQWEQKQFDGSTATFEIVKRNDTVIIIPVIDNEIALVKEQQPHWDKPGYTLVAGMVNPDEDLDVAAQRELEEEAGLIFENYHLVHIETNTPAVEWFAYTFIATGYKGEKEKKLDAGEKNEVEKVTLDKLVSMTRNRELFYRPRFIEDMLMQNKLEELKDMLKNPTKYSISL
ncbi:MAG TPA: NUDIX hydrolase [Clostridia bacterium]